MSAVLGAAFLARPSARTSGPPPAPARRCDGATAPFRGSIGGPATSGSVRRVRMAGVLGGLRGRGRLHGRFLGEGVASGGHPVGVIGGVEGAADLVLEAGREPSEVGHRLADLAGRVGEALRAQHDQGDQHDDDQLATPDVEHRPSVRRRLGAQMPGTPVGALSGGSGPQAAGAGAGGGGRRAHLGHGQLHLAQATQLELDVGGGLGEATQLLPICGILPRRSARGARSRRRILGRMAKC